MTIAIPTYNRASLLRQAIASAIAQTHSNLEILVFDNASSDETPSIIREFDDRRIKYWCHPINIGLTANWEGALSAATGTFFLMLSDDDRLAPQAITDLLHCISGPDQGGVAFAYGACEIRDTHIAASRLSHSAPGLESAVKYRIGYLRGQRINYPSATLFRTADIRSVGGYISHGKAPIDIGMAFAVSHCHPLVAYTGTTTTYYLFHPENFTSSLSINTHLESMCCLAEKAVNLMEGMGNSDAQETIRAAAWSKAALLAHLTLQGHFNGSINTYQLFLNLWQRRSFFKQFGCRTIPLNMAIRFALFHLLGVRSLSLKTFRAFCNGLLIKFTKKGPTQ